MGHFKDTVEDDFKMGFGEVWVSFLLATYSRWFDISGVNTGFSQQEVTMV